jgi:hypothetical protein
VATPGLLSLHVAGQYLLASVVGLVTPASGTVNGLAPIRAEIPVSVAGYGVFGLAVTVKVTMLRTAEGRAAWQARVHAALYQAYLTQRAAYDRAVAERLASAIQIRGRNPLRNLELIRMELRRAALSALIGQSLPGGPGLIESLQGYPEPNLGMFSSIYADVIQFLEQSFEWDQMTFTFFPYYWGAKNGWRDRVLLDDVDDLFAQFLRAGAVQVSFPIRPNYEAGVLHWLDTDELWNEGDPPPLVSEKYLPLLEEMRNAAQFPAEGVAVGDPYPVRVPTTLVKLRPDDKLPQWVKEPDGEWVEAVAGGDEDGDNGDGDDDQ